MLKTYFSNKDVNAMVFSFAQALAVGNNKAARAIVAELRVLWGRVQNGTVDVEDVNVVFHCLMSVIDGYKEAQNEAGKVV